MDRNHNGNSAGGHYTGSLSARRAWIEIPLTSPPLPRSNRSLSARRAWIEMGQLADQADSFAVALRKESVDRN